MARGIMHVEAGPVSPDRVEEFHAWYDQHVRELLEIDGVVSVRRYAMVNDDSTFVAMYELEGDDIEVVRLRIAEARKADRTPPAVRTDPPPRVRLLELIAEY